jgi:peptidoglycan/xylan/chitin deacetylase (PgdA/CDA1 family)
MSRHPALVAALVPLLLVGIGLWGVVRPGTAERATPGPTVAQVRAAIAHARPVANDCSAGHVTFTFDDGPDEHTLLTMQLLDALHLTGVFFVEGSKVATAPGRRIVAEVAAHGFLVENHTWDHRSFTGTSPGTAPLDDAEVRTEITRGAAAIVAAGLPRPRYLRPPYGDIDARTAAIVQRLGYQLVLSWGRPTGHVIDSRDWAGASADEIVRTVTAGRTHGGVHYPPASGGSVIAMHDGQREPTLTMLTALQPIVDWMNSAHLCSTATLPADTTGGVVARQAPAWSPDTGVANASLEGRRTGDAGRVTEPLCFEQGGVATRRNTARWRLTSAAHTGATAVAVDVTAWHGGDRKLVVSQRPGDAACLTPATPGRRQQLRVHYRGSWPDRGAGATIVRLSAYYRAHTGAWTYWTESAPVPPSRDWAVAHLLTPPLPAGATAVSFGLGIAGVGRLVVDDFARSAP